MRKLIIAVLAAPLLGACAVEVPLNNFSFQPSATQQQTVTEREAGLDKRRATIIQRLKKENPRLGPVELHKRAQEELQAQLYGHPALAYTSATEE